MYEFCKIHQVGKHQLQQRWQDWLLKMSITVKENISTASLKLLQPYINHQDDFNEPDGMYVASYIIQIQINIITTEIHENIVSQIFSAIRHITLYIIVCIADTLTAKLLVALPHLLKDHKVKPSHENLIILSPVSAFILCSVPYKPKNLRRKTFTVFTQLRMFSHEFSTVNLYFFEC